MDAIWTGAVANTISSVVNVVVAPLVQAIDDVIHFDRNTLRLQDNLRSAKASFEGTDTQFQQQQRSIPRELNGMLEGLRQSVQGAESVITTSQQRQAGCLNRPFCKPSLCRQIRKCNIVLQERHTNLQNVISTLGGLPVILSSAVVCPGAQLQIVPESGYVGTGIKSAEIQLNRWLDGEDNQTGVLIGIYGMGGIGKTSLLKTVYNTYKQLKSNVFQAVIWLIVSEKPDIKDLQSSIAKAINLPPLGSSTSNALETRKNEIFECLKEKKFLLILDDIWESIQLEEVLGIPVGPVGKDKGSKVLISSRRRDVIQGMGANDRDFIQIHPLSSNEGWQLFCRVAFKAGEAPTKTIEDIARQIAEECKGLPLALDVVAAALTGNTTAEEWHLALTQMKNVDPEFLSMYRGIDKDLYGRLKWSYDRLNDCNLQNCFLFCGAFPEDAEIEVDRLVEMWIGEGLVHSRDKSQLLYAGRRYVSLLVERCLFQYVHTDTKWIKVHDILRDMALYIAEKEAKCLFRTSQNLDEFPGEQVMDDCKRIAIRYYNDTDAFLPTDFRCPKLQTLILAQDRYRRSLREVPNGFLLNLTSLRVLDLSDTNITRLPESLWQLKQLEFLGLNDTKINSLPADISNLSRLQFLHLANCVELESLPCSIVELKNLKHLDLNYCMRLMGFPREISQLTSLNKLRLWTWTGSRLFVDEAMSGMCSLKDFTNFPNLMELRVIVRPGMMVDGMRSGMIVDGIRSGIKEGTMATWLEMRHLFLGFEVEEYEVVEDLPWDMQNMKKLQTFHLLRYGGRSLPNCICDFERLEELLLYSCWQLEELPPLERLPNLRVLALMQCSKVRELGIRGGFPMLERLHIEHMERLESISASSSSNVVWTEGTMPKLQQLYIERCPELKSLPIGIEKLSNLKDIQIQEGVWERLIWEDINIKICLEKKVKVTIM